LTPCTWTGTAWTKGCREDPFEPGYYLWVLRRECLGSVESAKHAVRLV